MTALLSAELAWYVTGRFYRAADASMADYGYFLHLAGITAPLFDGAVGEGSAHFTFAAQPFSAPTLVNGALSLGLDPVGTFSVYLQRSPAGDFDHPVSFAQGERIATFRRSSLVVGTAVAAGTQSLFSSNVFTAWLTDSVPFEFGGARHDLRALLGAGITQFGTAAATPVLPPPAPYALVIPFTGSAIGLGR